jgi:dGTP triphosphohydrolase
MSLNVDITPDLDDEEEVQERNEDDEEGEFCYRFSVRTRILLSLWFRRLAQKIIVVG